MNITADISLGELFLVIATVITFVIALFIGIKQNRINSNLLKMKDIIELFIIFDVRKTKQGEDEWTIPVMKIHNLGSMVVYLQYYIFNGRKYPVGNVALPTAESFSGYSYNIELPTNGENHVSYEIYILDPLDRMWRTEGFADIINDSWQVTHLRCEKLK